MKRLPEQVYLEEAYLVSNHFQPSGVNEVYWPMGWHNKTLPAARYWTVAYTINTPAVHICLVTSWALAASVIHSETGWTSWLWQWRQTDRLTDKHCHQLMCGHGTMWTTLIAPFRNTLTYLLCFCALRELNTTAIKDFEKQETGNSVACYNED